MMYPSIEGQYFLGYDSIYQSTFLGIKYAIVSSDFGYEVMVQKGWDGGTSRWFHVPLDPGIRSILSHLVTRARDQERIIRKLESKIKELETNQ